MSIAVHEHVETTWQGLLAEEYRKPYFCKLQAFIENERASGKIIYPPQSEVFNALTLTPFHTVQVVIIGQDPYHGPNQAHGLAFSVPQSTRVPPSLKNICTEIQRDVEPWNAMPHHRPPHGCLVSWAQQGVLLLNAVLTVEAGKPGSHAQNGWEQFTDAVIHYLNDRHEGLVFLLWGSSAQKKAAFVDTRRHLVLVAPHPSPLSAYRGFIGCGHFSKANNYLLAHGKKPIDWGQL